MKVRFSDNRIRIRVDDLEVAALERGEEVRARTQWVGGGWEVVLDPLVSQTMGEHGLLRIGLLEVLPEFLASGMSDSDEASLRQDGLVLVWPNMPKIMLQKDFGPQHL